MAWKNAQEAYNYIFNNGLKNAFYAANGGMVSGMDNSAPEKALQFLNGNGITGPGAPIPPELKSVPVTAWKKPDAPPPANLQQYVKVVQDKTSTPGVTRTRIEVDPNAPAEVRQYIADRNQVNSILGGIGGLAPSQLIPGLENNLPPASQVNPLPQAPIQPLPQAQPTSSGTGFNNLIGTPQAPAQPVSPAAPTIQPGPGVTAPTVQQPTLPGSTGFQNLVTPSVTTPQVTTPALGQVTAPTLTNTPAQVTPPQVPTPTTVTPPNLGGQTAPTSVLQQLQSNPTFASLPSDWQAQLAQQIQVHGFEKAMQMNLQWANENPNDPNANALKQWATTQTPIQGYGPASAPNIPGQNYQQQQNANQSGNFQTVGTSNNVQQQTSGQATNQQQTSQSQQQQATNTAQNTQQQQQFGSTGQTTQQQTGTTSSTGTSTVTPVDTLGFGALLQNAATGAQATDATRTGFLTDVMNTGGQAFNSQVDQAVRQSLSGPQVTGAGDSARARAAGYAGAQVARQNMGERLTAANMLAGPTALTSLSTAANPYVGQTQTNTGTTTSTGNTVGTQLQNGFNNLVGSTAGSTLSNTLNNAVNNSASASTGFQNLAQSGNETMTGNATGASSSAGAGQIPESKQVQTGGGGCIICTVGIHHGLWTPKRVLRYVVAHKLQRAYPRFRNAAKGYFTLFSPIARLALRRRTIASALTPLARAVVYEELRVAGRRLPFKVWPWVLHWSWHGLCSLAGRFVKQEGLQDETITRVAQKHGVYFNIKKD